LQQPIPFNHKHHVTDDGIDCRYYHTSVEKSSFAGNFTKSKSGDDFPDLQPCVLQLRDITCELYPQRKKFCPQAWPFFLRKGSYRSIPSAPAASATRYPVRPQLRELGVKSARSQQLQAVLRTPGGTAVIVFGILKMRLQEKFA
jgi:hypothetical protein